MSYDPVVPFLSICPIRMNAYVQKKTCKGMFMEALFVMTKTRNKPSLINNRMADPILLYSYNEILSYAVEYYNNEKEQTTAAWKHMDEYHKYNANQNYPTTKYYVCMILFI